ncbi:MAG: PTS mannose transporter subunit IID [Desulfuromonas sp.]|nr:MAG: PTS mannose transporter subunit IID [Desulfuromonas sp.]
MKLPVTLLIRTLWRSLLLQASWNYERMQNMGVLYALSPALRFLYKDEDLEEAYQRHLTYFNTHPYMSAPVLGATLAQEESRADGQEMSFSVEDFKSMIMAPYAAIGDALFWGGVRPLAACTALFFAGKGSLLAPFVFLTLFNLPHLMMRSWGFARGYVRGVSVVEIIQRRRLPDVAIRFKEGAVILLGGLIAFLTTETCRLSEIEAGWGLFALPVVLSVVWLARKGLSTLFLVFVSVLLVITVFQVIT